MLKSALIVMLAVPLTGVVILAEWLLHRTAGNPDLTHRVARFWGRGIIRLCGLRVRVEGAEHIRRGDSYVFVANHTSMLDIPLLLGYLPIRFHWLAKRELFGIPLFGSSIRMIGGIPVDRENPRSALKSMRAAAKRVRDGASLMIFPEGTRSKDGSVQEFKAGAFHVAVQTGGAVVPVAVWGAHRALPRGRLSVRHVPVTITITPPIRSGPSPINKRLLARQTRQRILHVQQAHETHSGIRT